MDNGYIQTEGEDFTVDTVPPTINIQPGTNRGCLIITILPSDLVEREETIELSITSASPEANITRGMATVLISSDGGTCIGPDIIYTVYMYRINPHHFNDNKDTRNIIRTYKCTYIIIIQCHDDIIETIIMFNYCSTVLP